jgi:O-antigen/teichoic acid export membrane protein
MTRKRQSLKINSISNWTSLLVQVASGFFLTPFVLSRLGKSGYGIWMLVGSFVGYYGLLNLGVESAITRYIARFSSQKDTKSLNETANTALAMLCTTGAFVILLSLFIADPLSQFFQIAPEQLEEFKRIILVLGVATGLSFPCGVFSAMITAREHFIARNIVNIFATLIRTGLTVVILLSGYGLAGIAYPTLVSTVISIIAFFVIAKSSIPEFKIQISNARLTTLKMLLIYGSYTTIIVAADFLRLYVDNLVIGKMIGIAEVGIYAVATPLIRHMFNLIVSGMAVLGPRFASLDGADKRDELRNTFLRALSVSSFLTCGISLLVLLFGQSFIFFWVGEEFAAAVPVLRILVVAYAFDLFQHPGIGLMYALNKHRYYAAATMAEGIANVLLSILLASRCGIIGVAIGTAIPMIFVKLFIQPVYVSRIIGIHLKEYTKVASPPFVVSIVILCVHACVIHFAHIDVTKTKSFLILTIGATIIGTIYCILTCIGSQNIRRLVLSFMPREAFLKIFSFVGMVIIKCQKLI